MIIIMNKQHGKIPQIRFPEFKEFWEHKYGSKIISYKYFSEIAMPFPSLPEQTRIAQFFTAIDQLNCLKENNQHF